MNIEKNKNIYCGWCNQPAQIVWVHGHGQCSNCGINIDECCRGEQTIDYISEKEKEKRKETESGNN